jgi:hypothetical protein
MRDARERVILMAFRRKYDSRIHLLRRGCPKNTIECHLEHQKRDLDAGLPCEALRYMWDPLQPHQEIVLNC